MRGLKTKAFEDELEELRQKKELPTAACVSLQKDAGQLAEHGSNANKIYFSEENIQGQM